MIRSSVDPNRGAIDCAAPFFFFEIELPSGRTYAESIATYIVARVENEDVPIIDVETNEQVGACVGANIVDNGVVGRMILLPKYKSLAEKWDMTTAHFSAGLDTAPDANLAGRVELDDVDEFPCIAVIFQ